MAALALQVQLAERAQSAAARSAALHELARGVERARRLVQQLMDFARLEPRLPPQAFAAVNLAALSREVVAGFAVRAERPGAWTSASTRRGAVQAFGAEAELRSLLENLVDNALRYAPAGSPVTVAVREIDDMSSCAVVDAGPRRSGRASASACFERFHRVAGDATRGTGLGLAIVKAIVERHHGARRWPMRIRAGRRASRCRSTAAPSARIVPSRGGSRRPGPPSRPPPPRVQAKAILDGAAPQRQYGNFRSVKSGLKDSPATIGAASPVPGPQPSWVFHAEV